MSLLITTLFLIFLSNFIIHILLKSKINKITLNFVSGVVMLPDIPIFWFIIYSRKTTSNDFYFPLIVTVIFIIMFVIHTIRFVTNDMKKG